MAANQDVTVAPTASLLGLRSFLSCHSPPRHHGLRHSFGDLIVVVAAAVADKFGLRHGFGADYISAIDDNRALPAAEKQALLGGVLLLETFHHHIGSVGRAPADLVPPPRPWPS